jgi:hypothetical protein
MGVRTKYGFDKLVQRAEGVSVAKRRTSEINAEKRPRDDKGKFLSGQIVEVNGVRRQLLREGPVRGEVRVVKVVERAEPKKRVRRRKSVVPDFGPLE